MYPFIHHEREFYIAALNVDSGTEDQLIRLKYYRKDVCNYRLP